jgi:hypothetical protein
MAHKIAKGNKRLNLETTLPALGEGARKNSF